MPFFRHLVGTATSVSDSFPQECHFRFLQRYYAIHHCMLLKTLVDPMLWTVFCAGLLVFLCFLLLDCQYSQYMSMLQHVLHFLHCDLFQSFVELWGISWCRFPQSSFFWIVLSQHLNNLGSGSSPSTPCPHRMHVVRNRKQWNAAFRCTSKII